VPVTRSATIAANWPGPAPRRRGHNGVKTAVAAGAPVPKRSPTRRSGCKRCRQRGCPCCARRIFIALRRVPNAGPTGMRSLAWGGRCAGWPCWQLL